ncbi:LysR family transcriptional regulator, partial [Pseudomonas gingeri]|uniref:LysR family transcriptional regulator n=2 Tax=Pseudomonas TaxID=286 RepID=UPI00159F810F
LRTKLFDRTTRQLRLTEEGRFYLQQCWVALRAIDEAEAGLQASQKEVRGKVRISASADFGRNLLNDWLEAFSALHPELSVALTLSDSVSNLVQDDVDLAIRF